MQERGEKLELSDGGKFLSRKADLGHLTFKEAVVVYLQCKFVSGSLYFCCVIGQLTIF